jgi:hypothetical protein
MRSKIIIRNEPCACPPGQCAAFVDDDKQCINRLADAITAYCDKCQATTWHSQNVCLRCQIQEPKAPT